MKQRIIQSIFVLIGVSVLALFALGFYHTDDLVELTSADPLLYSPHVNTTALREEVGNLVQAHRLVTEEAGKDLARRGFDDDPSASVGIKHGFLPVQYLKMLPSAIEGTQAFIDTPSFPHALRMVVADWRTAHAYRADAYAFYLNMQRSVQEKKNPARFLYLASETTTDVALRDARKIAENSDRLLSDARSRASCLFFGTCREGVAHVLSGISDTEPEAEYLKTFELPEYLEGIPRSGPYLVQSGCFPDRVTPLFLYGSDAFPFYAKSAIENYYLDVEAHIKQLEGNDPYGLLLLSRGIAYEDQPEGASYRCGNLSYWGSLSVLRYLEGEFEGEEVVSESDIVRLYQALPKEDVTHRLAIENQLMDLPEMLKEISKHLLFQAYLAREGYAPPNGLYFLASRSAYSLTYGTFSRSIWRLSTSPEFHSKENTIPDLSYAQYSTLKETYSDEEIATFNIFADEKFLESLKKFVSEN